MAAFVSDSFVNYGTRTNTDITAPGSIVDGLGLLIVFEIGALNPPGVPTPTPPAGFNILNNYPVTRADSNGFTVDTYAWLKIAASEAGNYQVVHSSASSNAYMVAVSGINTVSPVSPNPTVNNGLGTTATALGLTTPVDASFVLYWCSKWNFPGITPPGGTTPTLTTRLDGSATLLFTSTGIMSPQGATGDKIATGLPNAGNEPWASGLISLQAAAASGGSGGWLFDGLI